MPSSTAAIDICQTSVDSAVDTLSGSLLTYAETAKNEWMDKLRGQTRGIATQLMDGVEEDLSDNVPTSVDVKTDVSAGENKLTVMFTGTASAADKSTDLTATNIEVESQYNQWNGQS